MSVGSSGGDCVSTYEPVAEADSWAGLREAMLAYDGAGRVTSLRTQERGSDVGVGPAKAVRVVDLLNRRGRRVAQVEIWRSDDGWHAGLWHQCTD